MRKYNFTANSDNVRSLPMSTNPVRELLSVANKQETNNFKKIESLSDNSKIAEFATNEEI